MSEHVMSEHYKTLASRRECRGLCSLPERKTTSFLS
jgi:hypothetical protein